jgi:hypothetical protein
VRIDPQGLFLNALESTCQDAAIPCRECAEALFKSLVHH